MSVKVENWADARELALMSIGTNKGTWWADPHFGSELWLLKQSGKVTGQTAGTLRRMILEATAWLVADGLVKEIDCTAGGYDTLHGNDIPGEWEKRIDKGGLECRLSAIR